jgi:pyruvate-ferredoxin/flavodoxin oxidoreductase
MEVMTKGFELVREIKVGELEAADRSTLRGKALLPMAIPESIAASEGCGTGCRTIPLPPGQEQRPPLTRVAEFDAMFRAKLATTSRPTPMRRSASWRPAAATPRRSTSRAARRRCISLRIARSAWSALRSGPDTALPNCSQDLDTILHAAVSNYVSDSSERQKMLTLLPEITKQTRERMREAVAKNDKTPAQQFIRRSRTRSTASRRSEGGVLQRHRQGADGVPQGERDLRDAGEEEPGSGGIFSIFVSDLCKGCAACVTACGEHQALRMVQETEEVNAEHESGTAFLNLLARHVAEVSRPLQRHAPQDSKTATLRNMLMVRKNYDALVSGDGACAGCGEKSILRAVAAVTEAYMRPLYHAKADRFRRKADELDKAGEQKLAELKARSQQEYELYRQAVAHLLMGLGGEDDKDTKGRMAAHGPISDTDIIGAITAVLRHEAFIHKNMQPVDGRAANGMSVMAMAAHTGCNTVYGSTPPNNPHPYPWMNSLFQDGITVGWLLGESFIVDHGRRSVIPERLTDALMQRGERRHQPARVLRVRALHRRDDDRPGDPRAAEGLGRRRRRRDGRHRLSELCRR